MASESLIAVVGRVIVVESSLMPTRAITTLLLGTTVVVSSEVVVEEVPHDNPTVASTGVPQVSPPAFVQSMTTAWPSVGAADQSTDGSLSPDCQSRYHAMTLTEPVPLPAAVVPSANSVPMGVQPLGFATVIEYVFHDTNRNMRSPAAGVPGMVTLLGSVTMRAQVPAVFNEIAILGCPLLPEMRIRGVRFGKSYCQV